MNALRRERRPLRPIALVGAVFLLVLLAALSVWEGSSQASVSALAMQGCPDWAVVQSPNVPGKINALGAVSAASKDDIWAVGYTRDFGNAPDSARTLAMHWDGKEWKIVATPNPNSGDNYLDGVVSLGPNDAWAVGDSGTSANARAILLHWDGTSWTPGNLPPLHPDGSALYTIMALAPNDIWAIGYAGSKTLPGGLVLHYDGSQWGIHKTFTYTSDAVILFSAAARSANDLWVVGITSFPLPVHDFQAHWDGSTWEVLDENVLPSGGYSLAPAWDVALAPGAPDRWLVGTWQRQPGILHRDANEWTRTGESFRVADYNNLRGVVATSNTDVWAVGYGESPNVLRPLIARTTNGVDWTALPGAAVEGNAALYDIAAAPGGDLVAVGAANGVTLVEMYRDLCAPEPATSTPEATPTSPATPAPTPVPTFAPTPIPGEASQMFPETGKTVSGIFLDYWQNNGGLAQQGYPISDMFTELSTLNGKPYTVQYFERAVFEYHPENQAPYNVLLSQLGTYQYKKKYPSGAPGQTPNTSEGSVLFSETGKRVGGKFLEYWQSNGGLAQQGYPISDEFMEKSDLNGQSYLVQYFERAVFELHPENQAPYDVLLSQLGTFQYEDKYSVR